MKRMNDVRARRAVGVAAVMVVVAAAAACGRLMGMMHSDMEPPPASAFGYGPRGTADGLYTVTLQPPEPLTKRRLQKVNVSVVDAHGEPVTGARITIDGGMPQHGHGLPTRPRMTGELDAGIYEIDGVRFNMGGWWEFKLTIVGIRGTDSVTFNLSL